MSVGRKKIAIAGATGFIGEALRRYLMANYDVLILTRSEVRAGYYPEEQGLSWRYCDLFYLGHVERALKGVEVAIYLVHSQLPNSRLTQAAYQDLDLLIADNFARGARQAGVKSILYLSYAGSESQNQKTFIGNKREIERVLGSHDVPVSVLRAGMIIGPGGTTVRGLLRLARRLPALLLPQWSRSLTRPVALEDVTQAVGHLIARETRDNTVFYLAGPEAISFSDMLLAAAKIQKRHPWLWHVPLNMPRISRWWLRTVAGMTDEAAGTLVSSMEKDQEQGQNLIEHIPDLAPIPFDQALTDCLDKRGQPLPNPRLRLRNREDKLLREERQVRSVQRLPRPRKYNAEQVGWIYSRWLPGFVWPFLVCKTGSEGGFAFYLRFTNWRLLGFERDSKYSGPDRTFFRIVDGMLTRKLVRNRGRLEFREVLDNQNIIAAIHNYSPRLPWYIYNFTQAPFHVLVMWRFRRYLERLDRGMSSAPREIEVSVQAVE